MLKALVKMRKDEEDGVLNLIHLLHYLRWTPNPPVSRASAYTYAGTST